MLISEQETLANQATGKANHGIVTFMNEKANHVSIKFEADKPMSIQPLPVSPSISSQWQPGSVEGEKVRETAKIIKAYLSAAKQLLKTRYSHVKDRVPVHLADPGNVLVVCCEEGVVIRYDQAAVEPKITGAWMPESLAKAALLLSQNLVYCSTSPTNPNDSEILGMELSLDTVGPTGSARIGSQRLLLRITFDPTEKSAWHAGRPRRLAEVRNKFELLLDGETSDGKSFTIRTAITLPVGWRAITVLSELDLDGWRPEFAEIWAEMDILAAVTAHHMLEAHFQQLDPLADARAAYAKLLQQFKTLLDQSPKEEVLQIFLRDNPALLCPAYVDIWPKLALGARKTDFVFRDAKRDYLLVELERPELRLFRADGHQAAELTHAVGQVHDWRRYIEDNLPTVQRELGLDGISASPRALVVIGRSGNLTPENLRTLTTMSNSQPTIKIMTYDDLYAEAKSVIENLLGPLFDTGRNTEIYFPTPKQIKLP